MSVTAAWYVFDIHIGLFFFLFCFFNESIQVDLV